MSIACNSFTNKCNPSSNSNLILYDAKLLERKMFGEFGKFQDSSKFSCPKFSLLKVGIYLTKLCFETEQHT